ncbi:TatD family hydrolase [Halotalea alkalilenta]|nr:TatD family hydrolase [Halotalea alkalilenta]
MTRSFTASAAPMAQPHFVDSHCHLDRLDLARYQGSLDAAIDAAVEAGVGRILAMATDLDDLPGLVEIARRHRCVEIAAGVHPLKALEQEPSLDEIRACIERFAPVAVGEIGLDFADTEAAVPFETQRLRFRNHLIAATEAELPVSVHTRAAGEETLALIRAHASPDVGGVLHCFTDDIGIAREAIRLGFYVSLSGIVTFHRAENVRELARRLPLDRLLIETDSPWLAPVPHRGSPNEPRHVVEVAKTIAEVRGISLDEVRMQTSANFYQLFSRVR